MCSPGDHGWVIAGEIWPGQVLSFLRDPINASRWRTVKARPCYYIAKGQNNALLLIEQHSSWSGWLVMSPCDLGHKVLLCRFAQCVPRLLQCLFTFNSPDALLCCCYPLLDCSLRRPLHGAWFGPSILRSKQAIARISDEYVRNSIQFLYGTCMQQERVHAPCLPHQQERVYAPCLPHPLSITCVGFWRAGHPAPDQPGLHVRRRVPRGLRAPDPHLLGRGSWSRGRETLQACPLPRSTAAHMTAVCNLGLASQRCELVNIPIHRGNQVL